MHDYFTPKPNTTDKIKWHDLDKKEKGVELSILPMSNLGNMGKYNETLQTCSLAGSDYKTVNTTILKLYVPGKK